MALQRTRRRFTVTEYHQMAQAGILGEDDRVELIDGEILEMTPIGRRHAACVARLSYLFEQEMGGRHCLGPEPGRARRTNGAPAGRRAFAPAT
jgi:Uma2 family endonuclease